MSLVIGGVLRSGLDKSRGAVSGVSAVQMPEGEDEEPRTWVAQLCLIHHQAVDCGSVDGLSPKKLCALDRRKMS